MIRAFTVHSLDKRGYQGKKILFLYKNIHCEKSSEAPRKGASADYHNICFCGEIRKISTIF